LVTEVESLVVALEGLIDVQPAVAEVVDVLDDELDDDIEIVVPDLPPGRDIELRGRGKTFVRELPGPPGAPTLILLHGWTATSDLNWFTCYQSLGETCRVVALDHRGHGNGIRSRKRFKLADCADDVIALADELGIEKFIPVGYSMGGTVAQLIAHRYPERVPGLVLCSTAGWFASKRSDRLPFLSMAGLAALARVTSPQLQDRITQQMYLDRKTDKWDPWAVEQVSKHDWRMVLEAGQAIGAFTSREWLNELDMPTSIVMTIDDHVIPIRRQMALFERIRGAEAYRINGDHDAVAALADTYVPLLCRAIASVIDRAES
jgi:3-oxoadipate enol-lactonase